MTPPLPHHTKASADAHSQAGTLSSADYLYLQFAQSSRNPTKPQHHPENAQREARWGRGGGYLAHRVAGKRCKLRVNCAPSPWDVAQAAAFFTSSVLLGIQCGRNQDTTRCVSAMGATTMPIIEPPSRWKVQTVRLPAIVSRSTFRFTTGHRQLGIRKLSTSSSVLFLVNAVQGSPPARSLSVVVSAPPPSLSALSRVC